VIRRETGAGKETPRVDCTATLTKKSTSPTGNHNPRRDIVPQHEWSPSWLTEKTSEDFHNRPAEAEWSIHAVLCRTLFLLNFFRAGILRIAQMVRVYKRQKPSSRGAHVSVCSPRVHYRLPSPATEISTARRWDTITRCHEYCGYATPPHALRPRMRIATLGATAAEIFR
jgi:hypothetical protein